MRKLSNIINPKYFIIAITSILMLSTFILTYRLAKPIETTNSLAATCSSSLYPRCKDGTCGSGYKCGQDESGGCKCIPVSSPTNTPTSTTTPTPTTATPTITPTPVTVDNTGYIPVVLTADEQVINNEASVLFDMLPSAGSTFIVDFDYKKDKYLIKLFGTSSKEDFNKWAIEKKMTNVPTDYYIFNDPPQYPGDSNSDGQTDGNDFLTWLQNYSSTSGGGIPDGDYYTDGAIDIKDYLIWITSY